MRRDEIINQLAGSEVNRPVEITFLKDVLNFSALTRYSAAIRCTDEGEFYIVVAARDKSEESPDEDALKGEDITIFPLDISFAVQSSFYDPNLGHLLRFSDAESGSRRFLRIAFDEKMYVSIIGDGGQREKEETEVHGLDLSGSGIAFHCHRGSGLIDGTDCQIKIANPDFPGYDPIRGTTILKGRVVRRFLDENLPDWENFCIQFIFDDISEEFARTHQIDEFCRQVAFPDSQENKDFQHVLNLTANLSASLDVDTLLSKITTSAAELVSSAATSILLFDEDDNEKSQLYFKTTLGEKSPVLTRIGISSGVAWWVGQTGEPAVVNEVAADPRFTGSVDEITGFSTKSLLAVPIIWEGEILGVLEAVNKLGDAKFTHFDLQLFTSLANQIAIILKNTQMMGIYENFFTHTIELIVKAIESVGVLLGLMSPGHCWRVAAMATAIGEQVGISGAEFENLYYGAITSLGLDSR